jgi:hypothetical protein
MLTNRDRMVKEVPDPMLAMLGRLVRGLLKLALLAGAVAALVALARKVMGDVSGEPGVADSASAGARSTNGNGQRPHAGIPMSFDSWPPVPPAGQRSGD